MKTNIADFLSTAKTIGCADCGSLFLKQNHSGFCPICGGTRIQEVENTPNYPEIELLIGFQKNIQDYEQKIEQFIQPVKFKADQLNLTTLKKNAQWVFFPFWLVDSKASGYWQAEFGFNYLVESSVEKLQNGEWISQKTNETRIDWKPRAGTIEKEYFNISIAAQTFFRPLNKILGQFDLSKANENTQDYKFTQQIALISPNVDHTTGWQFAQQEFEKLIKKECQAAAAAQHTKTFSPTLHFRDQKWTLLLLPYLVCHYLDDTARPQSIWINGQTLQIKGDRASSPIKGRKFGFIYLMIAFFLFLFTLLMGYLSNLSEIAAVAAFFTLLGSIGFLIAAIYAFFYPGSWNKNNTNTFERAD